MPMVGGKKYPYTQEGKQRAKKAAIKQAMQKPYPMRMNEMSNPKTSPDKIKNR